MSKVIIINYQFINPSEWITHEWIQFFKITHSKVNLHFNFDPYLDSHEAFDSEGQSNVAIEPSIDRGSEGCGGRKVGRFQKDSTACSSHSKQGGSSFEMLKRQLVKRLMSKLSQSM